MANILQSHIQRTLDKLDSNGLKRFKDELGKTKIDGQQISTGKLQDARNNAEVASLLFSHFHNRAGEVVISVLKTINKTDLATELEGICRTPPKPSTSPPPPDCVII